VQPVLSSENFADILGRLLVETHTSVRRLEYLSGVSRRTLENWVHGNVKRPRNWEPVLEVARALHLSAAETDRLLRSAGQPSLASLQTASLIGQQAKLLTTWYAPRDVLLDTKKKSFSPPNNLPLATTSFIGRETQLEILSRLLSRPNVRLVTITGPGGIGKTRLAQEAARRMVERFAHGVYFVSLEAAMSSDEFYDRIITTLSIRRDSNTPARSAILNFLRDKQILLVLDTFENMLPLAGFVGEMIQAAPDIHVLITSRVVLRLSGEHVFQVPLLKSPREGTALSDAGKYEAIELFVTRVQAVHPEFFPSQDNLADVIAISQLMDGLPLALELAAARTRILSLQELRMQLVENPVLLADGPRDVPARQRSIQDTIAWSYKLLNKNEQTLFRRLSVFNEGCSLAAVKAVASRELLGSGHFIDVLSGLLDQSLLQYSDIAGQRFYHMHGLTRHYAHEQLVAVGESDQTMIQLLNFVCDLAEHVDRHFRDKERSYWLGLFDPEANNIWLVFEWAVDKDDPAVIEQCLLLCSTMRQYWGMHGQHDKAGRWTERMIQAAQRLDIDRKYQIGALLTAAAMALIQADVSTCADHANSALEAARGEKDEEQQVRALHLLGLTAYSRDALTETADIWEEALQIAEKVGNTSLIALALDDLGNLAARQGDYERTLSLHLREQTISQEGEDLYSEFYAVVNLAEVSMHLQLPLEADMYNRRALELAREIENPRALVHTLCVQARLMRRLRRPEKAREYLVEAIHLAWKIQNLDLVLTALEQYALSAEKCLAPESLTQLVSAIAMRRRRHYLTGGPEDTQEMESLASRLKELLGAEAFRLEWRIGQSLTWEKAVALTTCVDQ